MKPNRILVCWDLIPCDLVYGPAYSNERTPTLRQTLFAIHLSQADAFLINYGTRSLHAYKVKFYISISK